MGRRSGHERETLRISAEASTKLLAKLRDDRSQLDDRIAKLQAVVDAWDSISGKRAKNDLVEAESVGAKKRVPKGQVAKHVEEILHEGGEYDEPTLRKEIENRFNEIYSRATVYTCLRRGHEDHKYVKDNETKKWKLNPMRAVQKA